MAVVSIPTTSSNGKTTEPFLVDSYPSSPLNSKQVSENGSEYSSPAVHSGPIDQSDHNYQSDSSSISRKDVEVQSPAYLKSEEYRLLFRLPTDEMLIQDFNCAFQESILLQGHMYLFIRHICFYSNIFGFETKKTIPLNEMTCVRKAKTAGIFPNAIEIVAGVKKYYFASFLSRDEAYRLIVDGWSQHINGTDVVIDHQDLKSEIVSEDRVGENYKGSEQQSNDLQPSDRNKDGDGDLSGASKLLLNGEDEVTVSSMPWEAHENGEEAAEPVLNSEPSSSRESLPWRVDDADAPKVPDYYTKVAESKFPVQVEELFNLFFSDKAVNFIASFRKSCGDKDFRCTPWSDDTQFGLSRQLSFQHPIKVYFGAKFGQCHEVQKLRVYRNSHLVIETSQDVSEVPYADYFRVEGRWIVERDGNESNNSCNLRVYVNVAFLKKTMWKGKIEQSTMDECREAYSIWIDNAHALLKQQIEKLDGKTSAPDMNSSDTQFKGNERNESSLTHDISNDRLIPLMASDTTHGSPPMENSLGGYLSAAASFGLTLFRESLARFSVYLKSQNHLPLVLVVASVLILLMQLSIIVLLTRAPQVHLISQIDHMNGIGSSTRVLADAEAWLEKRIHYLKDEMHMIEARLEKMLHEHAMLKEHFKGLELLRGARQ